MTTPARTAELETVLSAIRACRRCVEAPQGKPLPHEPRPVLRASITARLAVCSQAPGTKVHASGTPFTDRSGDRLRDWMGVTPQEFYDERRLAIVPMGFCFPGQDTKGADLPPRRECAPAWRAHLGRKGRPCVLPLPHPSWRNNAWLKDNPWFEHELLPALRREVRKLL